MSAAHDPSAGAVRGRHVLVTGGSSGIGRALVRAFAAAGAEVSFTYHRGRDRADALIAELPGLPVRAFAFEQGVQASHEALLAALPRDVEVLVNNAGLGSATVRAVAETPEEQDLALMRVNAVGPLWLARAVLPAMRAAGWGKLIQIASVGGGIAAFPGFHPADGMSKAALAFLTRLLAAELVHEPVEVFALCPGATDTAMFAASTLDGMAPAARAAFEASLPKGRMIAPEEIAALALHLCGDPARILHGAVIDASAGLGVRPGVLERGGPA